MMYTSTNFPVMFWFNIFLVIRDVPPLYAGWQRYGEVARQPSPAPAGHIREFSVSSTSICLTSNSNCVTTTPVHFYFSDDCQTYTFLIHATQVYFISDLGSSLWMTAVNIQYSFLYYQLLYFNGSRNYIIQKYLLFLYIVLDYVLVKGFDLGAWCVFTLCVYSIRLYYLVVLEFSMSIIH